MQSTLVPESFQCLQSDIPTLAGGVPLYTNWASLLQQKLVPNCPLESSPYATDFGEASPATSFSSGSSAQFTTVSGLEDLSPALHRDDNSTSQAYIPRLPPTPPATTIPLLDRAPPIFSLEETIGYGSERVIFVEKLIWTSCETVYSIYGAPTTREPGPTASRPLEDIVHEGIIHGLCNEIVILPLMQQKDAAAAPAYTHSADKIPFPLFMAEMLRRMRSSCFLLRTAMRYVVDLEAKIKLAKERSECGYCRAGMSGCEHESEQQVFEPVRFSRGRFQAAKAQQDTSCSPGFASYDQMAPLVDPRKAFLGALILANKFHRDRSVGNKVWASMIGLPLEEVHAAERAVGIALEWKLSRPWVSQEKDANGSFVPGSLHPSIAEPLFANSEAEVERYAVKQLRDKGVLPPPGAWKNPALAYDLIADNDDEDVELDDPTPPAIEIDATPTIGDRLLPPTASQTPIPRQFAHLALPTSSNEGTPRKLMPLPKGRIPTSLVQGPRAPGIAAPIQKANTAPAQTAEHVPLVANNKVFTTGPLLRPNPLSRANAVILSAQDGLLLEGVSARASKRKAEQDDDRHSRLQKGAHGQRVPVQLSKDGVLPGEGDSVMQSDNWHHSRLRIASLLNAASDQESMEINVIPPLPEFDLLQEKRLAPGSPYSFAESDGVSDLGSSAAPTPSLPPLSAVGSFSQPMQDAIEKNPLWEPETLSGELDAKLKYLEWAKPSSLDRNILVRGLA